MKRILVLVCLLMLPAWAMVPQGQWKSETLDGDVYARPIVDQGLVYTVTQNNTAYALDAKSGRTVWKVHVGAPVSRDQLPCGNIRPDTGMLSTPVYHDALFALAFVEPGQHELVKMRDGKVLWKVPADPPGLDPRVEQQRGALGYAHGRIYVPYGGLYGDCGDYHGAVVAIDADTGKMVAHYIVPSQRMGGIWAPQGEAFDAAGNVYVATGNSESRNQYDFGNAVLRLSPDLQLQDWFAAGNWKALNAADRDIGSLAPALLNQGLIFQVGKSGVGYLLHVDRLGQVGGAAFHARVSRACFGGTAYADPTLYVSSVEGIIALHVDAAKPSFSIAWRGATSAVAGPPVISHGAVWTISYDGNLYAFDAQSGQQLVKRNLGDTRHFATPAAEGDFLFVPTARQILCYRLE
ncbi:MAG: outer membrane protein assembly factor BamB family protein [Candidatus Xenobia bacterium]